MLDPPSLRFQPGATPSSATAVVSFSTGCGKAVPAKRNKDAIKTDRFVFTMPYRNAFTEALNVRVSLRCWRYGFRSGFLDSSLLPGRCRLLRCRLCSSPLRRPHLLRGSDDCSPASGAQFSLPLRRLCRGWRLRCRFALDLGPPLFLGKSHSAANCETPLPTLWFCRFRRCGGLCGATGKQGFEFDNLFVDPAFLGLKPINGGGDNFWSEFWCWHVVSSPIPIFTQNQTGRVVTQLKQRWLWSYAVCLKSRLIVRRPRLAFCRLPSAIRRRRLMAQSDGNEERVGPGPP